jgi:hypothetical protein
MIREAGRVKHINWKKIDFTVGKLLAIIVLLLLGLFFSVQLAVIVLLWSAG